jgi:hypothetical protein
MKKISHQLLCKEDDQCLNRVLKFETHIQVRHFLDCIDFPPYGITMIYTPFEMKTVYATPNCTWNDGFTRVQFTQMSIFNNLGIDKK